MLPKKQIERINQLARKSKAGGLTLTEQQEQKELREKYLSNFRKGMRNHVEGMKVVDEEGNDVTPERLKQIQKEKGIHDR